jgi:hypothetical protein
MAPKKQKFSEPSLSNFKKETEPLNSKPKYGLSKFKSSKFVLVILVILGAAIILGGFMFWSEIDREPISPGPISEIPPILAELTAAKRLIDTDEIVLEKADVTPQIPDYALPLKTKDIANWNEFSNKIQLSPTALSLLEKNGFVVLETSTDIADSKDDFAAYYQEIGKKDLPVFITSDSLLHYYHIFFDTTLMKLERDLFYNDLWQMSQAFFDDALNQYNNADKDLKEATKRNVAYLAVILELLKPQPDQIISEAALRQEYCTQEMDENWCEILCEILLEEIKRDYGEEASFKYFSSNEADKYSFEIPYFVKTEVEQEIELIKQHKGWENSPIFIYQEDYSQYVPRGHYTKSEKLKNYFKAMMWSGRMTALIKGSPNLSPGESMCTGPMDGIISEYDAKIQTLQASLLTKKFLESTKIQEKWERMYAITSFFVGFSDDLGPYEYSTVLESLFEENLTAAQIEEKYTDITAALENIPHNPKIYSGLGNCQLFMPCPPLTDTEIQKLEVQAKKLLEETKGFRLMGQRFTVDSWLFSEIVSPYSGEYIGSKIAHPFTWVLTTVAGCPQGREVRGFPRGLDIMALFGSERAKQILENSGDADYSNFEEKFSKLKASIDALETKDWFQNLYWNWLYVLRSLLTEFDSGYPTFMQTQAWQDKELNTALASWTELRHDTILYVKQSYTMTEMGGGPPSPQIVGYVEPVPDFYARLLTLTKMTNKGLKGLIPQEELEKLKVETTLNSFSDILNRLLEISKKELENQPLEENEYGFIENFGEISENLIERVAGGEFSAEIDPDILKSVLVADVHTDGNTKQVLEEGVGFIKNLVTAYKMPQGHILVGIGPVFSYYEFKQPMTKRLTDEAWREMLNSNPPSAPEWIKSFSE